MVAAPRPTNVLRGLEKSSPSVLKNVAAERQVSAGARAVRREPVLRRLDPAFTSDDSSESWEPKGTLAGA
ncbi:MAG TPA: hypothetical protein VFU02_24215, partial [Polyangiaceae bacterium]|nr:hypothetical protein [Polyangiaceae bacterium]